MTLPSFEETDSYEHLSVPKDDCKKINKQLHLKRSTILLHHYLNTLQLFLNLYSKILLLYGDINDK